MVKLALALALVIALPAVARADAIARDSGVGWDGGVVYQIGSFPIGPQANTALGTRLEGGMHVGHLSVLGEYTFYDLDPSRSVDQPTGVATTSWSGQAHRFGATLRYRICLGKATLTSAVFSGHVRHDYAWLELGAGEQLYGTSANQSRRDVAAGLGWQRSFRNARGDRQVGFVFAVRATQAPSPHDPTQMAPALSPLAACRGACPPTPATAGVDRSFLFTAGVVFGS